MPQPTPYSPSFSFTEDEAQNPNRRAPGVPIDAEFAAIANTVTGILANLAKVQRDDGKLANAIVTLDTLSPAVILTLGAGGSWTPRGAWVTATAYGLGDVIQVGTTTYVCAVAHVSAALFATDNGAGKWVRLYDSAGVVPSDGSVTAAKLAPGAVTAAAIGFNSLDLTGSVRGQGGIAAGEAPPGSLFHAKKSVGDVYARVERAGEGQGEVGLEIIGAGNTWGWIMPEASGDLELRVNGARVLNYVAAEQIGDFSGTVRVFEGAFPTFGAGTSLNYVAGVGYVTSYDYDADAWKDLRLRGKDVYLSAGGLDIAKVTSLGINVLAGKYFTLDGSPVGYLGIPQNAKSAAYELAIADAGKHVYSENVGAQLITVPNDVFGVEDTILVINDGSANITLSPKTGAVQLRLAGTGTIGARTITPGGMAFIKCVKNNRFFVSGPGVL